MADRQGFARHHSDMDKKNPLHHHSHRQQLQKQKSTERKDEEAAVRSVACNASRLVSICLGEGDGMKKQEDISTDRRTTRHWQAGRHANGQPSRRTSRQSYGEKDRRRWEIGCVHDWQLLRNHPSQSHCALLYCDLRKLRHDTTYAAPDFLWNYITGHES